MWKPPERIKHPVPEARWPSREEAEGSLLFSPLEIGAVTLEQRTWVPAMVPWRATEEGFVTPEILGWYERFARGRPGALVVEATGIRDVPSGPLGTSRMPVASTTSTPGRPRAKRSYQSRTSGVTKPSALARQGTIAGTQVRSRAAIGPIRIGLKSRLAAASSRVGQRASRSGCLIRSGGFHTSRL